MPRTPTPGSCRRPAPRRTSSGPTARTAGHADYVHGDDVRVDQALESGQEVSARFDPMLAKVIVHGPDREAARERLVGALDETVIAGLTTNVGFVRQLVASEPFAAAAVETLPGSTAVTGRSCWRSTRTGWVERWWRPSRRSRPVGPTPTDRSPPTAGASGRTWPTCSCTSTGWSPSPATLPTVRSWTASQSTWDPQRAGSPTIPRSSAAPR